MDWNDLKARVSFEMVMRMLDLSVTQHGEQWRGKCPACQTGNDRALVITPSRGFYCFAAKTGGDQIALTAHIKKLTVDGKPDMKAAAIAMAEAFGAPRTRTEMPAELQALTYLEPAHEALKPLGVDPDTAAHFESGYAPKGIMSGRYAVPIFAKNGKRVAYVGIATKPDHERLKFPKDFPPELFMFNWHNAAEPLTVVTDPLDAILAHQNGVEGVISFLGQITPEALQTLAMFMTERQIAHVSLL